MRLTIDVQKDCPCVSFGGHEIELVNIPEDRQWKIDELRRERDRALAELEARPWTGVSPVVAAEVLRDAIAGAFSHDKKINCIRMVRQLTGLSFKESKDIVDGQFPSPEAVR